MKNLTKILFIAALLALTFTSCKKTIDETQTGDRTAFLEKISDNRDARTETFVVDLSAGQSITSSDGLIIDFPVGSLKDANGNIVTGNAEIKLLDVYTKGDMLLINKPTMGKIPNGDHVVIKTGGEFLLTASQNGEALEIVNQLMIKVPVDNTGGADNQMILFDAPICCDNDCDGIVCEDNVWEVVEDTANMAGTGQGNVMVEDFAGVTYYTSFISNFGWTNVDRFYSYSGAKTTLLVDAPDGFDNTNCAIYISYDGEPNALATLDSYIENTGLFSEHYGQIPVGQNIHVIAVSIVNGSYSHTIKAVTIVAGETIVLDDLVATTESQLITAINNLP